ncbi:MAG: efflux RND transporter periplasmic adaptor subunit [Alphaproteobacteria bacterium TMED54]|nr:MAG: efflux RND transporter periplasmic adaptor subunit [Alphaproteobacteria bacterium TMED54]
MKIFVFLLISLILHTQVYAQQKSFKKGTFRAAVVEVVKASKTQLYSLTPSYGRIISLKPYAIISKVNEEVKKVFVLEGAEVVKGQKLLELESKNIKRLILRYKAEILYNQNNQKLLNEELSIVSDKLKRFLNLKNSKVISNDLYDDLRIKKINLKKLVAKVEFDLKKMSYLLLSSKEDLNNTVIKSPINGNLTNFDIKLGSFLKKGTNIGSILDPMNNEIETSLRSDLALKLKPEFPVQIINENKIINSTIRAIIASENIKTGSRLIKIKVPTLFPNELNFPNRRVELKIPVNDGIARLVVPKDALIADGLNKFVYIIVNNKAKRKKVLIGQSFKDKIEIKSGINEGDKVVVRGNENIRQNQSVKIQKFN